MADRRWVPASDRDRVPRTMAPVPDQDRVLHVTAPVPASAHGPREAAAALAPRVLRAASAPAVEGAAAVAAADEAAASVQAEEAEAAEEELEGDKLYKNDEYFRSQADYYSSFLLYPKALFFAFCLMKPIFSINLSTFMVISLLHNHSQCANIMPH